MPQVARPVTASQTFDVPRAHKAAYDALMDFKHKFGQAVAWSSGVAGNGSGTVEVPGAVRRAYVRIGGTDGPVTEARYETFVPADGDGVLLRRENPFGSGGWLIVNVTNGTYPCVPTSKQA